jgi:hypothetical protein
LEVKKMQNNAYTRYLDLIQEVLLKVLEERGEIANPEQFASQYITLLQQRLNEVGLTPEVFNPFLAEHIKGKAVAAGVTGASSAVVSGETIGETTKKESKI